MRYKEYNVVSDKTRIEWGKILKASDREAIRKKMHYTKKVTDETIRRAIQAGSTPNKVLFDAIQKYFSGKVNEMNIDLLK